MSYAAVMVYIEAYTTPERRVRLARDVANRFGATLIGLTAEADRLAAAGDIISDS